MKIFSDAKLFLTTTCPIYSKTRCKIARETPNKQMFLFNANEGCLETWIFLLMLATRLCLSPDMCPESTNYWCHRKSPTKENYFDEEQNYEH